MDEKEENPFLVEKNYDAMTDEEYYAEMEKKVEYYRVHYPDMYAKAQEWIKMLDHSEVFKEHNDNAVPDTDPTSPVYIRAKDILKNVMYNGLTEEDLTENERTLLRRCIPNWKDELQ